MRQQSYFNQTKERWFADVEPRLAQLCLTYASGKMFASGPSTTWDGWDEMMVRFPLIDHIATWLGNYPGLQQQSCTRLLEKFLLSAPHVRLCLQVRNPEIYDPERVTSERDPAGPNRFEQSNGTRLAIEYRLRSMLPVLLYYKLASCEANEYSLIHRATRIEYNECLQVLQKLTAM
jgi:hypothetical protein